MFYCCSNVGKAIINNDMTTLRRYVAKRRNLLFKDNLGWTPLHVAVQKENIDIVNLLLRQTNIPVDEQDVEGNTCLLLACKSKSCNINIVHSILNSNPNVNIPNNMGFTPVHLAAKHNNITLLQILINHGADLNYQDYNEYTPLHYAVEGGCEKTLSLLLKAGANANICELNGLNPLMLSLLHNIELATTLIPYTSDLNAKANDGWTALMFAVNKGNLNIIHKLIHEGANVNVTAADYSVLTLAIRSRNSTIFEWIWNKIDADEVSGKFVEAVLYNWTLHIHTKNFNALFSREDINFNIRDIETHLFTSHLAVECDMLEQGSFNMFALFLVPQEDIDFEELRDYYFHIIKKMLNKWNYVSSLDMKAFLKYFCNSPYVSELIHMVIRTSMPNITANVFSVAIQEIPKHSHCLLPYCVDLDKDVIFEMLLASTISFECVVTFMNIFTLSLSWKKKFAAKLWKENLTCKNYLLLNGNLQVDSLKEIARDAIRKKLRCVCFSTKHFLKAIEKLHVPNDIKDIILLSKISPDK